MAAEIKPELQKRIFTKYFYKSLKVLTLEYGQNQKNSEISTLKIKLGKKVLADIYNPDETWIHGVLPDYAIDNIKTKKTLYVEVKRQDGWVEGKPRNAGRGNAHERSCKFFTPGLLRILREKGKLGNNVLPFWVVFQGDIARDPKRVREITCWYDKYSAHFFMWSNSANVEPLISHFKNKLKHLLT